MSNVPSYRERRLIPKPRDSNVSKWPTNSGEGGLGTAGVDRC